MLDLPRFTTSLFVCPSPLSLSLSFSINQNFSLLSLSVWFDVLLVAAAPLFDSLRNLPAKVVLDGKMREPGEQVCNLQTLQVRESTDRVREKETRENLDKGNGRREHHSLTRVSLTRNRQFLLSP